MVRRWSMKKIQVLIITFLFLTTNVMTNNIYASFLQSPSPYSFGPEGRTVSDLRDYAKPNEMVRILPNMPVASTDSEGNRIYYTPDGKMTLSVSKDGSMSFSLGGTTKKIDSEGKLKSITTSMKGSGLLQETRNDKNEVVGYTALNGEGKTSVVYDKDKNVTATYHYKGQGARLDYVQNEMTKGRTYFDDFGRSKVDVDADGYVLKTYQYGDVSYVLDESDTSRKTVVSVDSKEKDKNYKGSLVSTRDYSFTIQQTSNGEVSAKTVFSTTHYDKQGSVTYVEDSNGIETSVYVYKKNTNGDKILDYVLDNLTKNKTYFNEDGTRNCTKNDKGAVVTKYYDNEKYSVNYNGDNALEVTKYGIDGKELYTTLKNVTYNSDGSIDKVKDANGNVLEKYEYSTNSKGDRVIKYVENVVDGTKTYYDEQQRQTYTEKDGVRVKEFNWNGNTLVYTYDTKTQVTQYYNMDKELVYVAFNEKVISKNIYNKGQLVGKWDAQNNQVVVYVNERSWISVKADEEPSVELITAIITHKSAIDNDIANSSSTTLDNLIKQYGTK
jgi:hypothetical protein